MKFIILASTVLLGTLTAYAQEKSPQVYTAICADPSGGQTFYLQQKISEGRHTALEVAKVDALPSNQIDRLLVFSAMEDRVDERDAYLTADLKLIFSSDAQQYNLIAKADITLGTQGETGPIIEGFRFHHQDGRTLQIVEAPQTLECRST